MANELNEELTATLKRLVSQPPMDEAELRRQVEGHMAKAGEVMKDKVFFDSSLAKRLGSACIALLDTPGLDADNQRLVQAACVYYVEDDDEDGDFTSIIGFEDDAQVFNHVAQRVGRPELIVAIE